MSPESSRLEKKEMSEKVKNRKKSPPETDPNLLTINMGPQHPSTHGVLRLVLELDGEVVRSIQPHLGYLHRGMEKIAEQMTYHQFIPYTDRLDYLASLSNNVAFVLTVEKLLDIEAPPRAQAIRVISCELSRISAHLLWLGTHALDLGAATVFFHTFREREVLYDLIQELTGTRMTTSYTRVGGLANDASDKFLEGTKAFVRDFPRRVDEYEKLLTENPIWLRRTREVGILNVDVAIGLGVSGPNLRASGKDWDLRKVSPYCGYEKYLFDVPVGQVGDVYDRYLVRMEEMRQSNRILEQALRSIPAGPVVTENLPGVVLPEKERVLTGMEELIHQFMVITEGIRPPRGEVYHSIEAPKGELGFYIVSEGEARPHRLRIRSPSFMNLQAIPAIATGGLVADVVAVIASLDPVMGEVDR